MQATYRLVTGTIDEKRTVTSGEQLHVVAAVFEYHRNESRKTLWRQVFGERTVDILGNFFQS